MRNRLLTFLLGLGLSAFTLVVTASLTAHWLQRTPTTVTSAPGPIDIGFAQSMSLHHQQAIAMSQLLLDGRPSGLTPLAKQIGYAQLLELGEMRGWLKLWEAPLLPPQITMNWMLLGSTPPDNELLQYLLDCQQSPTGMSGLATDDELAQLRTLEGQPRDRHFLELMLLHHQGGLPMARFAAAEASLPVVRQLALHTVVEQTEEVAFIQRALAAMDAMASRPTP
jgi:uncharacterized protein (DUF305 family)